LECCRFVGITLTPSLFTDRGYTVTVLLLDHQ
jgi:hypothetical protein